MFILIDTTPENFIQFYGHVNELDDKPVVALSDVDYLSDYKANGSFHVVDLLSEYPVELTRWQQLVLARLGGRVWTDKLTKDSPVYAGPVPDASQIRKISVDGHNAETRSGHFDTYGVNYVGRTKLDPRNIFVLDNKKGNPLHDPSKDPLLEALYGSLPEDWWGSCGFVSTGNVDKLEEFFLAQPEVIPIAWTTGATAKLKFYGLDYVWVGAPTGTPDYGIAVRDKANRLSYELSLDPVSKEQDKPLENGTKWVI